MADQMKEPKIQVVNATGLPLTTREVYDPRTGVLVIYIENVKP